MDFMTLAKKRQSTRGYTNEPVSAADLTRCLEAAAIAPSACNSQPWRFVTVTDPGQLAALAKTLCPTGTGVNQFAYQVPVLIAVVEEQAKLAPQFAQHGNKWAQFDLGLAVANLCLQAAELELGTCIMGAFDQEAAKALLGVPAERHIEVIVALGHPSSADIRAKVRKPFSEAVSHDRY